MGDETACSRCGKPGDQTDLVRCPSCYKMVCRDCRHNIRGRYFCTSQCAQFYFFEGEEEESS